MKVRGAPAIGATAAFGLALAVEQFEGDNPSELVGLLQSTGETLKATRPTAVNLAWAVDRVTRAGLLTMGDESPDPPEKIAAVKAAIVREARRLADEDVAVNRRMGAHGAALVPDTANVLTHCNTGSLATVEYGTALGVIRAAAEAGKRIHVYVDETRPFLQGARLTAWELQRDGIPLTLISDNMAGHFMMRGAVDLVIVGADRIAANGDVANKIGTYTLAVLCKENGLPFYVAAPTSTVDLSLPNGLEIPIEERAEAEVTHLSGRRIAPEGVRAAHPAFDVTPNRYVTAIITEQGVHYPPFEPALRAAVSQAGQAAREGSTQDIGFRTITSGDVRVRA
jgi:methylthioribose-1-phosphate isomerase